MERYLETRKQRSHSILCTLSLRVGDEMYVHTVAPRVSIDIVFDLREEAHSRWRQTERDDT